MRFEEVTSSTCTPVLVDDEHLRKAEGGLETDLQGGVWPTGSHLVIYTSLKPCIFQSSGKMCELLLFLKSSRQLLYWYALCKIKL